MLPHAGHRGANRADRTKRHGCSDADRAPAGGGRVRRDAPCRIAHMEPPGTMRRAGPDPLRYNIRDARPDALATSHLPGCPPGVRVAAASPPLPAPNRDAARDRVSSARGTHCPRRDAWFQARSLHRSSASLVLGKFETYGAVALPIVLPALIHFYEQKQMHGRLNYFGYLATSLRSDRLDCLAGLPKHDLSLALAFNIYGLLDAHRPIRALLPLIGLHRRAIGQFLVKLRIKVLPGDFRRKVAQWGVCDLVIGIMPGARGDVACHPMLDIRDPIALQSRDHECCRKTGALIRPIDNPQQKRLVHRIDLVDEQDLGAGGFPSLFR